MSRLVYGRGPRRGERFIAGDENDFITTKLDVLGFDFVPPPQFQPYFNAMPPETQKYIIESNAANASVLSKIMGKWNYYKAQGNVKVTEAGLADVAGKISADLLNEGVKRSDGVDISADHIKALLISDNYFSVLWNKTKDIITPPSWIKYVLYGGGALAALFILRPYVEVLGKFKRSA